MRYIRRVRDGLRSDNPRAFSGATAGLLIIACGLYACITLLLPAPPGFEPRAVLSVGLVAVLFGSLTVALPWGRLPDVLRLTLPVIALGLIALHNLATGLDPFRYGFFYFVTFLWAGLCEPRGTSLKLVPWLLPAYLLPLIMNDASASDLASIGYALPIYLITGEVLAWRTSRLRRAQRRLERLAHHDPLTDLPNRAVFTAELRRLCAESDPVAVLFLDLDEFKQINDRLGHAAGDDVLTQVAGALRESARLNRGDLACRLAGDEFVVLLPDTGLDTARTVADRLRRRIRSLRASDGSPISGSIGVAAGQGMDHRRLLALADEAMYTAKEARLTSSAR